MFTGITEETGTVEKIVHGALSARLTIHADKIFEDLKIGDSVSVNGVCLTASEISGKTFTADVMVETVRKSNIGTLKRGGIVNLERAAALNGRLGGHIVSGHIDGTGIIRSVRREDNAQWIAVGTGKELLKYMVNKGSVAIDGVSLTIAETAADSFSVSVIPHTCAVTALSSKRAGDTVNIECDIIAKYTEALMNQQDGITKEFLEKYNF